MKINFLKKRNNFKKKGFDLNPNFYWEIIFALTVGLLIASFVFSFHLFLKINKEPVSQSENIGEQVPTVSKDRIGKILDFFLEREQKSSKILNSLSPVVDPSL